MAELLGLLFSLVFLAIVLLPILTFIRLGRIGRELELLRSRVDELERHRLQTAPSATRTPTFEATAPIPTPVDTPSAVAPPVPSVAASEFGAARATAAAGGTAADGVTGTPSGTATLPPIATSDAATPPSLASSPDLEEQIGGRGLLYAGVFILLLGVSFFLKYAFDNAWVNETARAFIGAVTGAALIAGGLRLAGSGLLTFGHALVGAGFAVLYLVVYAALNFYYLIDRGAAFVMMVIITGAAAVVADRQRSQALAVIAVAGGFLTPALVGGDENAQLTLFTYVFILVIGTMVLAFRHHWHGLNAISYLGTLLTVTVWTFRFYTDPQWLRTLLFLTLFLVSFLIILRRTRRPATWTHTAVRWLLLTAPAFYHLAALALTTAHPPAIHIYLIAFTAAGLWLTVDPHRPWLRLVVLLAALAPMFGATTLPSGSTWLLPNVIAIAAVALLHLMALVDRVMRQDEALTTPDLIALHLTGLGLFSLLYESLLPSFPRFRGALALLVALGVVALGRAIRDRDHVAWLNTLALAFTLVAVGIAVQFDGAPVVMGWAAEGAAIAWIGVSTRNRVFQFGGFVLWILATLQLVDGFYETPAAFTLIFNWRTLATMFVLACGYVLAWRVARSAAPESDRLRTTLHVVASALTVAWITAEIRSYWDVRPDTAQAHVYEQMLLSLAWGVYGAVLIAAGMWRQYAPVRYIGMVIIVVTALKVFFYDLWELGGIYRVIGFLAFGVLLVLVSYLYQNRRRAQRVRAQVANDDDRPQL